MRLPSLFRLLLLVAALTAVTLPSTSLAAEQSPREEARAAADAGEFDRALSILEQAYMQSEDPALLFERVLVLEKMGEQEMALQLLEANEEAFRESPDVEGVTLVRQRLVDGEGDASASKSVKTGGGNADILGWGLTVGGLSVAAGGVAAMVSAQSQARRLRCSPDSTFDGDCEGVDSYGPMSPETYNDRADRVHLTNALGIGATVVGVGLGTWGLLRLLSPESQPESARIRVFVNPAGKRAGLKLLF
jgi:tetratricopeptide (TPR) repeat protein